VKEKSNTYIAWLDSPADGGKGLRCGGRTAPYGRKALGITILGGKSLGVVAAAGCSPRPCSPKGRLWILVPEPALGLVRFSGASGSTCGAGGDEDDAGGWSGGGDDLSVVPVALVGKCPGTQLWWGISCKKQESSSAVKCQDNKTCHYETQHDFSFKFRLCGSVHLQSLK